MPKASALKQASAMYRFLCSRESRCMLAEFIKLNLYNKDNKGILF